MSAIRGINLSSVPTAYLSSYPFPAFVANFPDDGSSSAQANGQRAVQIIWGNDEWTRLTGDWAGIAQDEFGRLREWALNASREKVFSLHLFQPRAVLNFTVSSTDNVYILTALGDARLLPEPSSPRQIRHQRAPSNPHPLQQSASAIPITDCKILLETKDWSKTKLGPRASWSPVIETMISMIMASPTQDSLWLGEDFQMIYNEHYCDIVDHPKMFGRSAQSKEAWGPVWEGVQHLIDRCLELGEPCHRQNDLLLYRRGPSGFFVEKYHTWSFIPIFDKDGSVLGMYNPTMETTDAVLALRRQATTRDMSERMLLARTSPEYFAAVTEVLERNPQDVPFAITYRIEEDEDDDLHLYLESTVGVPTGHSAAPAERTIRIPPKRPRGLTTLHPDRSSSPTPSTKSSGSGSRLIQSIDKDSWPIAQAISSRQCVVVNNCSDLIEGFPIRQWEHLPEAAMIVPICSETSIETPRAVMIIGLNLQCPLDTEYEAWIQVMRAHLASTLNSVRAFEAESQRILDKERMERAKTAWFQGAAHDLRSPLTLVAGPLDDTLRTTLTSSQRQSLTLAQRNLSRVQRLVNALLDFSRIEAGKLEGHFVPSDLGSFVSDLAALFRPAADRKKIGYTVEIESYEGLVDFDPTLLETVVTNLISNAVKYTEEGQVEVRLKYNGGNALIAVTDTGMGIPSLELGAVTDRFHRATTALSRGTEGTGIGLALAKEIIRLHGGDLLIVSQTTEETGGPHGSTFTARIPLVERATIDTGFGHRVFGAYGKEVAREAMHGDDDSAGSDTGIDSESSRLGRSEDFLFEPSDTLLLVDDNTDMRQYIRRIISPFCKVVEARNGEEALQIARTNPPDLILSDQMMPTMTGTELLAEIRRDPLTRTVPMMLVSAATDDELRTSALLAGADDFLLKPFRPKELLARVHLHMQLGKKRSTLEMLFAQREQEIKLLSDYCPSGIIRAAANGILTYANTAWRRYAGLKDWEDVALWTERVDSQTHERLSKEWNAFVIGDQRELTLTWKWMSGVTTMGTFIRLDLVRPDMEGILGCLNDITHQEERLRDSEQRRIEAEEAKRQQELLVDFTSHEIRTPVSAILQCSSLVKENLTALQLQLVSGTGFKPTQLDLDDIQADIEALESIYQCGLYQTRIADDVLSLARIQLDMLSLHDVRIDLKKEAHKVVSVFSSEAKMLSIQLQIEFGPALTKSGLFKLQTDPVRLGQVLTNLISNAIRFTSSSKQRKITVHFEVSTEPPVGDVWPLPSIKGDDVEVPMVRAGDEETPAWLFVSVQDTGPGINPQEQALLFQRFTQGNKMIHTQFGGSGLGLFICKQIVELLGGQIEVQSQIGKGTAFRFFIKTRTVPKENNVPSGSSSPAPSIVANMDSSDVGLHLLVVEDNVINQTVLKRQILKAGLTCEVANHGQEALDKIHATNAPNASGKSYDAILMDLEMPVMDGLTAIKNIRELEATGVIPRQLVFALTGNARQGQIDQALAAGMDDVVIKPYKLPDLIHKLRTAVLARRVGALSVG